MFIKGQTMQKKCQLIKVPTMTKSISCYGLLLCANVLDSINNMFSLIGFLSNKHDDGGKDDDGISIRN